MKLDPKKTACLTLDFQKGVMAMVEGTEAAIPNAVKLAHYARQKGFLLIHVGVGFADGYPEIAENSRFARFRGSGAFTIGSSQATFLPELVQKSDLIVYKHRVSAFCENQLQLILRSRQIENLILFGVATSGIVLSTVRQASDLDYQLTVISDACFDGDPEVHRVLTEKVFTKQASVQTAEAFISEQGA